MTALVETHSEQGIPLIDLQAGELTTQKIGELLYFLELSAALSATMDGIEPFPAIAPVSVQTALSNMGFSQ